MLNALFRYCGYERMILDTDLKNERASSVVYFEMGKADWFASWKKPLEYTHTQ